MMDFHEVAGLFPLMQGKEFEELCQDIKSKGLVEAIWLHPDGRIIDGRNRYRACQEVDIKPKFRTWNGKGSLIDFVLSLNLHRRHLTSGQKATLAVEVEPMYAEEAKERQGARNDLDIVEKIPLSEQGKARDKAAKATGTNGHYVSDAKKIKQQSPHIFEQVKTGELELQDAKRLNKLPDAKQQIILDMIKTGKFASVKAAIKQNKLNEQIKAIETTEYPKGKYHVIVVDPPWKYRNRANDITHRAANPYPDMTINEIKNWEKDNGGIPGLALDDCILWLWVTNSHMKEAYQLAEYWEFEVKTILTWVKDRMGLGDWLRGKTEHCLMCVRGNPVINLTNQTTVINGPSREHSRKPDEFYTMIEELCPGSKIDIFSRTPREGWKRHGNESEKFQI